MYVQESIAISSTSISTVNDKAYSFDRKLSDYERSNADWKLTLRDDLFDRIKSVRDDLYTDRAAADSRILMLEKITDGVMDKISVSKDLVEGTVHYKHCSPYAETYPL
jgi:hypothetical protein